MQHSVRLLWVPGHNNVSGNETADELAKQAAAIEFIGPEPVVGFSSNTAQNNFVLGYFRTLSPLAVHSGLQTSKDVPSRP